VCGNGSGNISTSGAYGRRGKRDEWEDECEHGPVRVAMDIAQGQVIAVRAYVGGRWKAGSQVTDLGTLGDREAVDYLLGVVAHGSGKAAEEAIFPATIADSVALWPRLLDIAKDDSHEKAVRKQAVFWVSQAAGEKATQGLVGIVGDQAADQDVRLQAVFALSQRPKDEGVPALVNVAQSSKDPKIRKQAIFWLGQSNDPRAIAYFEKILTAK
jgi:HEAT repeat protein